jgi:hypothetical protein
MGAYGDLTEGEQAHWNEYTNLRQISDWPGFDDAQDQRRADSRTWLQDRRAYIADLAEGNVEGEPAGWDTASRQERYDFLADDNLNAGAPKHEVRLPCSGTATDAEKSYIEEREVYLVFGSTTDEQKARKQANVDWLVDRRKRLWHLMKDDPENNEYNDRQARYDNLCIATHHGQAYEEWDESHNKYGDPYTEDDAGGSGRSACVANAKSYIGVSESPPESNRGSPQPSGWQNRTIGYDGVPWCACFTSCMAWDAGVVGSATASVSNNIEMAKKGQGMYSGYTSDRSRVHSGDHVAIGCSTCHIEVVADPPDSSGCNTIGGNTSPGDSGSQYNGGCVANRRRAPSEIVGYLLVRF